MVTAGLGPIPQENLQRNKEVGLLWKGARREEEKGKDTALRHLLVWAGLREGEGPASAQGKKQKLPHSR